MKIKIFIYLRNIFITALIFFSTTEITTVFAAETADRIIAIVNNRVITQRDIEQRLIPFVQEFSKTFEGDTLYSKIDEARISILNRLINDALILEHAKSQNVIPPEEKVEEKLEEVKSNFESEEAFNNMLIEENLTMKELKEKFREQIIIKGVIEENVFRQIIIAPNEIAHYYNEHIDDFTVNRARRLSNILIKFKNTSDEDKSLLKSKATKALKEIREGVPFEDVAKQVSDGLNKERGGDMGYVADGELLEIIESELNTLREGEVSQIIETGSGYHIFKILEIRQENITPLADVQGKIRHKIYQRKAKEGLDKWINRLKKNAYISIR